MNIALVALATDQRPVSPPLTLAYVAAVLEQQRHIVRIYDLALSSVTSSTQPMRLLRAFRPQIVIVAGEQQDLLASSVNDLRKHHTCVLELNISRDADSLTRVCSEVLTWVGQQHVSQNNKNVILRDASAIIAPMSLNILPLPARHLVVLERYDLQACGGELQTTLMIGQPGTDVDRYDLRCVSHIVNELRSVSREHGVRHYRLCGAPLTYDCKWLDTLLHDLAAADLEMSWEGLVDLRLVDASMLALMHRAGCEALRFSFDVSEMLESADARRKLKYIVAQARQQGIYARAELSLEAPYDSIPQVVDVAATFGLDDVVFQVPSSRLPQQREVEHIKAIAWKRYSVGRNRQHFIDRYGNRLGSIVWNVRQSRLGLHLWGEDAMIDDLEERRDIASAA